MEGGSQWSDLQRFILPEVTPTGEVLGTGAYGLVLEVKYAGLVCTAKTMHDALLQKDSKEVETLVTDFYKECTLLSSLCHPNITQFMGVCLLPEVSLPLLVVEKLEMNLEDLLESSFRLLLPLKLSILEDVCCGLNYLHTRKVVHRDLTARNVLLTSSLTAKICDMSNTHLVCMESAHLVRSPYQLPTALAYMAPEAAIGSKWQFESPVDMFSFGHLALYTLTQEYSGILLPHSHPDPHNPDKLLANTEVERRQKFMDSLTVELGPSHHTLVDLVKQCLHNNPKRRPSSADSLTCLNVVKMEVERICKGRASKLLDIQNVLLAKSQRHKSTINEITLRIDNKNLKEQLKLKTEELGRKVSKMKKRNTTLQQEMNKELIKKSAELNTKIKKLQEKTAELQLLTSDLHREYRELEKKDYILQQNNNDLQCELFKFKTGLQHYRDNPKDRSFNPREILQDNKERLPFNPSNIESLKFPLQIKWKTCPNMPFKITSSIQSVAIQDVVYVGGVIGSHGNRSVVVAYNVQSQIWNVLEPYEAHDSTMVVIGNQLVLIGGTNEMGMVTNKLAMWDSNERKWTHPYAPMPTARSHASAVVYKQWLFVAGGKSGDCKISDVEILDLTSQQWVRAPPAPELWTSMKSALVGDIWYLMGGFDSDGTATNKVYSVSLPALLFHAGNWSANSVSSKIWTTVSTLGQTSSFPLCVADTLLAVGGISNKDVARVCTISYFMPESGEWDSAGQLPSPLSQCTGTVTSDGHLTLASSQGRQFYIGNWK